MEIKRWMEDRKAPGKLANVARRILESDVKYRDIERALLSMYVLEALALCGGNQQKAAAHIGVCRHTIQNVVRGMNLRRADIRRIAEQIKGESHGKPTKACSDSAAQ